MDAYPPEKLAVPQCVTHLQPASASADHMTMPGVYQKHGGNLGQTGQIAPINTIKLDQHVGMSRSLLD